MQGCVEGLGAWVLARVVIVPKRNKKQDEKLDTDSGNSLAGGFLLSCGSEDPGHSLFRGSGISRCHRGPTKPRWMEEDFPK